MADKDKLLDKEAQIKAEAREAVLEVSYQGKLSSSDAIKLLIEAMKVERKDNKYEALLIRYRRLQAKEEAAAITVHVPERPEQGLTLVKQLEQRIAALARTNKELEATLQNKVEENTAQHSRILSLEKDMAHARSEALLGRVGWASQSQDVISGEPVSGLEIDGDGDDDSPYDPKADNIDPLGYSKKQRAEQAERAEREKREEQERKEKRRTRTKVYVDDEFVKEIPDVEGLEID